MGFTLSASDREKLQKVIKDVNALTLSKKQGRSFNQFNREYTYVKLTSNVLDGGSPTLFWYASEVSFDTAGLPVVKASGKVWDVTTNPLLIEGEVGAVNDVVRVEPSALSDGSLIWLAIKPASGGGGSPLTWIKTDADETDGTGTGTVYAYRGSVTPLQAGDPLANIVVTWNALDVANKGTIKAGNWFCCTENAGIYYPINIPVVL